MIMKSEVLFIDDDGDRKDIITRLNIITDRNRLEIPRLPLGVKYEKNLSDIIRKICIERVLLFSAMTDVHDLRYMVMSLIYKSIETTPIPVRSDRQLHLLYSKLAKERYNQEEEDELVDTYIKTGPGNRRLLIHTHSHASVDNIVELYLTEGGTEGPLGLMTIEERHACLIDYARRNDIYPYGYTDNQLYILEMVTPGHSGEIPMFIL